MALHTFPGTDHLVERYHREEYFPDASYAVFSKDEVLHQGVCGGVAPDTWFDLASLTKLFVTTAVLSLIQKGSLQLCDSIADRLPIRVEYPALYTKLKPITIESLLTHTSGLPAWYPFYAQDKAFYPALEELTARESRLEGMNYSDIGFILLGRAIEYSMACPLPEALSSLGLSSPEGPDYFPPGSKRREELLSAGSIAVSSYGNSVEEQMCAARGLAFDGFRDSSLPVTGQANDGNCWYYFGGISGHAGLFAPVSALTELGQFYLRERCSLFSEALQDRGMGRGLGFEVDEKYPKGCGHTGFTGTSLWISPQNGIGAAMLSNRLAYGDGRAPKDLHLFRTEFHNSVLKDLNIL